MKNAVNWFEIPTSDLDRAARFYEQALGLTLKREVFGGMPMAIFPFTDPGVGGALVADPRREPSQSGTLVYLSAKIADTLTRVRSAGGAVLMERTPIGAPGFIAMIRDPEGNHIGLHEPPAA